jgi:hypothetical protein
MAKAVSDQAEEAHSARLAREIAKDQPILPSAKFSFLFTTLLALLNVREEAELPEFWFNLSSASKKQEFSIIRESLDAFSRSDQAYVNTPPIPTPKLVSDLTTLTFVGDHTDDLKTGIQPFMVMDGSEHYQSPAQELARNNNFLSEREFGLSYADLDQFKIPKELRTHPITFYELEKSLGLFGNFIHVVHGANHPVTSQFRNFWTAMTRQYQNQLHYEIDVRRVIKPVHILRNIQLICFHWFQAKRAHVIPSEPQFLDILTRISLLLYTNPNLPHTLYQLIAPKLPHKLTVLDDKDDDTTATALTGLSTLTSGSRLTSAVSGGGVSQLSARGGTFIKNAAVDAALQGLLPPGIKINDLVGSDPVPLGDDNNPICLSFHIRGACFSNCRRKDNHSHTLSAEEKSKLSNWIVDQTAKLKAKFNAP